MPITVTPKAASEILRVVEEQKLDKDDTVLRLGVQGNGYSMSFAKKSDVNPLEDTMYVFEGLNVAVARNAERHLNGTSVDYFESLERRGFIFDNPAVKNVSMSCSSSKPAEGGCGGCGGGCSS